MIQIIQKPKKTIQITHYKITCKCGCIFTCTNEDVAVECCGFGDYRETVHCPICGKAHLDRQKEKGEEIEITYETITLP